MKSFLLLFLFLNLSISYGQNLYKTPSGKKYHLASCRMVENVSMKLNGTYDISRYHLAPCKICKPPVKTNLRAYGAEDKSVGKSISVQCVGLTKRGTRCRHKTSLANGYCYQHTSQNSNAVLNKTNSVTRIYKAKTNPKIYKNTSSSCGAKNKTKTGHCRRRVKGGGRCWQHGG